MSYVEKPVEQLGSSWVKAQSKKDPGKIMEARAAGALDELLAGRDVDGCPTCGGTGRKAGA